MLCLKIYKNTHVTLRLPSGEQITIHLLDPYHETRLGFEAPLSVEIERSDVVSKEVKERK